MLKVDFQIINHTNSIYHTLQTVHAIILKRNKIKKIKEEDAIQIAPRDEEEDGFIWSSMRIYLRNVGVFATDTSDAIGNSYIFSFVNQNKYNTIPIVIERMGGRKLGCIFSKSAYI